MKYLFFIWLLLAPGRVIWEGDIIKAKAEAVKGNKLILVNFSGSDWCGPCIQLRKQILETEVFESYATDKLILLRADFPRQKKNQLDKAQISLNESLADKYNKEGKFPYTLLINSQGKVLRSWDGYPNESPEKFIAQIDVFINASH